MRTLGCLLVLALLAPLSGCGDRDEEGAGTFAEPGVLSAGEVRTVRDAQGAVRSYCRAKLRALATGGSINPEAFARASAALERLGELARAKPEAELGDGASVRLALGDIAEDLEGTNCDQNLVEAIEALLAELPPP